MVPDEVEAELSELCRLLQMKASTKGGGIAPLCFFVVKYRQVQENVERSGVIFSIESSI